MKTLLIPLTTLALAAGPALAQAGATQHSRMPMQGQMLAAKAGPAAKSDGEVRKIDKDAGKITLKHGPIANLEMPPMTMVFRVKDRALLDKLKVGEKVHFVAEQQGGVLTVTSIEPAK